MTRRLADSKLQQLCADIRAAKMRVGTVRIVHLRVLVFHVELVSARYRRQTGNVRGPP